MLRNLMLVLILSIAQLVMAHGDHNHEATVEAAPHGGILRNVTNAKGEIIFKSEAVLNGELVTIHVYDKNLKPLVMESKELLGDVQFPKQKSKPVTFEKKGDAYEAKIIGIAKVHRYDMHVQLPQTEGPALKADFGIDNIH